MGLRVRALLAASLLSVALLASGCSRSSGASRAAAQAEPAADAGAAHCPAVGDTVVTGRVQADSLDEISGLVASRKNAGVLWVHNDSGDYARTFAIDARGRTLAELKLAKVDAEDIEDITLMPGQGKAPDVLYLADIGNNITRRNVVQLYRVEEPRLDLQREHVELKREARSIDVVYDDGRHDAEALLADPTSGDLYIVTKSHKLWSEENVGVYRLPAAELLRGKVVARKVASVALGPVTAGDIAADGSALLLRNYWSAMYWPRAKGESIAQALSKPGCRLPVSDISKQGESIGFLPDGRGYVSVPEGSHPGVYFYPWK